METSPLPPTTSDNSQADSHQAVEGQIIKNAWGVSQFRNGKWVLIRPPQEGEILTTPSGVFQFRNGQWIPLHKLSKGHAHAKIIVDPITHRVFLRLPDGTLKDITEEVKKKGWPPKIPADDSNAPKDNDATSSDSTGDISTSDISTAGVSTDSVSTDS